MTLQDLLDKHGIRHFRAGELLSREERGGPKCVEPPEVLWERIIPTLHLADEIRARMGSPVRVVSGYRTPSYNKLVGGAPLSEHVQFRAMDLAARDLPRLIVVAQRVMEDAADAGMATGLGLYDTFIHIDTGSVKKHRRRWDQRTK